MSTHRIVPAAVVAGFALITALPADAKPVAKPNVKPATAHVTTAKTHGGPKTVAKPSTVKVHANGNQGMAVKPAKPTNANGAAKATKTKSMASVDHAQGSSQKVKGTKVTRTARNDDLTTGSHQRIDPTTMRPRQLSKAQQHLLKNDHLRAKMDARLPRDIDPVLAAAGFKNLGQFVAAVNVSHNQGIEFKALRDLMTGEGHLSLGQALQQLKGVDAQTASAVAENGIATANREVAAADVNTTKPKAKRNDRG
jgi:hypothetical protein